jgi:hypothetical protein
MHFCFFGSSVTEQDRHHLTLEPTGYVTCFEHLIKTYSPHSSVSRISQGGSHLNSAGVLLIDDVVSLHPDICFFEWHSTGLASYEYCNELAWACYKLSLNSILPVILVFPRTDRLQTETTLFKGAVRISALSGVDIINLSFPRDTSLYLRDSVHTTSEGGQYLANEILARINHLNTHKTPEICRQLYQYLHRRNFKLYTHCTPLSISSFSHITFDLLLRQELRRDTQYGATLSLSLESIVGPDTPNGALVNISGHNHSCICSERGISSLVLYTKLSDKWSVMYKRKKLSVLADGLWWDSPLSIHISMTSSVFTGPARLFIASNHIFEIKNVAFS